jgi:hypothetical protein
MMTAPLETTAVAKYRRTPAYLTDVTICIGRLPIRVRAPDPVFLEMLAERYSSFLQTTASPRIEFDIHLLPPGGLGGDEEVAVRFERGVWQLRRGDFRGEYDARSRRGRLTLSPNPYSVDAMLRIVHSIVLAREGGFLLHAAGGIRNGRGYLFSGVSGAGKTTLARLAPPEVRLLTDEISYVRRESEGYRVYGTPFSGELGLKGMDISAPLAAVYLIAHGSGNRLERIPPVKAAARLLRNTLFFARDPELVAAVFAGVCDLAARVAVYHLEFVPDSKVWGMVE